jgi:hypothetical protein
MPVNASVSRFPVDAELVLRAEGLGTVTAATNSGAYVLPRDDSYWGFDIITDHEMAVVIEVESVDTTTGDETYTFSVVVDDSAAFSSASTIVSKAFTAAGTYVLPITREQINKADSTATHLRVQLAVAGTTPICAFNVRLAPLVGG